jgi:hypothetical protein
MHGASVGDEVESRPWVPSEEFRWQEIALEAIAPSAGGDEIAGRVNAALGERKYVIDRGEVELERGGAVDTAPAAVTHHGVFDRALLVAAGRALGSFGAA